MHHCLPVYRCQVFIVTEPKMRNDAANLTFTPVLYLSPLSIVRGNSKRQMRHFNSTTLLL